MLNSSIICACKALTLNSMGSWSREDSKNKEEIAVKH